MAPMPFPLRALGISLRLVLLLGLGPTSDGNLKNRRTRARWIAFRRWVSEYEGGRFRLIGLPEESWDWPHIDLPGPMGYGSIEALLLAAERAQDAGR